jgi:hypothetical protein
MKAHWEVTDLEEMGKKALTFTPFDQELIRRRLTVAHGERKISGAD